MGKPTLSFVGAGKLGTALAKACTAVGYRVAIIYSRAFEDAGALAEGLSEADAVTDIARVADADLTFLTVPDDAIAPVCASIPWTSSSSVVHCSGALSLDVLKPAINAGASAGSLHPLQTFAGGSDGAARLADIAYALEASDDRMQGMLETLVAALGGRAQWIRGSDKPLYHASAAMASNYLATLLGDAAKLWESFGFSRANGLQSLLPLVRGTMENLEIVGLPDALTGPIARGDVETVRIHLQALTASHPDVVPPYVAMGKRTIALGREKGTLNEAAASAIEALLDAAERGT
jgi:predicted short-subunit dehydrogenase-like oxidoreductase (DUF2520 family)